MSLELVNHTLRRLKHWGWSRTACFGREVTASGIAYFPYRGQPENAFLCTIDAPDALLSQLQRLRRLGLCQFTNKKFEFDWEAVYRIAHGPDAVLSELLKLNACEPVRLALTSAGAAGSPDFDITIIRPSRPKSGEAWLLEKDGEALPFSTTGRVLSLENYQLIQQVQAFRQRAPGERCSAEGDAAWRKIVLSAQAARAEVGRFITRRVTLDIENLRLLYKAAELPGQGPVAVVVPYFTGSPPAWCDVFLQERCALNRYAVPSPAGVVQVEVAECVAPIVFEAKRLQGRRMQGQEALHRLLRPIDMHDIEDMSPEAFEYVWALIYRKTGYSRSFRVGGAGDGGVDVVALRGDTGLLVQCKSSKELDKRLGWEGVKDVVAGAAAYRLQYPGVQFEKVALTNQFFNDTARSQANVNNVTVMDKNDLLREIQKYHISYFELRHFCKGAV